MKDSKPIFVPDLFISVKKIQTVQEKKIKKQKQK